MNTEQSNKSHFSSYIAMESAYRHAKKPGIQNMEICSSLVIEMTDAIISQDAEIKQLQARVEELETSLAERDAEVARKAFIAGATDATAYISQQLNLGNSTVDIDAGKAASEYAERVRRGE